MGNKNFTVEELTKLALSLLLMLKHFTSVIMLLEYTALFEVNECNSSCMRYATLDLTLQNMYSISHCWIEFYFIIPNRYYGAVILARG